MSRFLIGLGVVSGCTASIDKEISCGEGTRLVKEVCVADGETETDTDDVDEDTDSDDTDPPTDTGDSGETAPEDTGDMVDTGDPGPPEVDVYLLGGQSNMVGIGFANSLPPSLRVAQPDVQIYWSAVPEWRGLQPSSEASSGWGTYFGPEVTFGRTMADASERPVHLIKHAVGGTDLAYYWNPGTGPSDPSMGEGYRVFSETVADGLAELEATGVVPVVRGMIWMQGEADAYYEEFADAYEDNLAHLIDRVRSDVGVPDMPFVAAQIDCRGVCPYRDTVNGAMTAVAASDATVSTFSTEALGRYPWDDWHYHGWGQRALGEHFAAELMGASPPELPAAAVTITGTYAYDYYGSFTVGWRFTTDRFIEVTDLGQFDLYDDGLYHSTTVGIWETSSQSLVVSEVVPAGYATDWEGGFRYVGCEPALLPPGDYVIGLEAFEYAPDYYVYAAQTDVVADVTVVESRYLDGNTLSFPTIAVETAPAYMAWLGPNMRFRVAE